MFTFISREKCLLITALLLSCTSWGRAESIVLRTGKAMDTQEVTVAKEFYTLQYGLTTVHYSRTPVDKITLEKPTTPKEFIDPFFSTPVEASIPSEREVIQAAIFSHRTLRTAGHLNDLKIALSPAAYHLLESKMTAGAKEINVLELIRKLTPDDLKITAVQFYSDKAKLVVQGRMANKDFSGIIEMIREGASWKLDNEVWFGEDTAKSTLQNSVKFTDYKNIANIYDSGDLPSWYDPYASKRNSLHLKRATLTMPNNSFFFFYFIDHDAKKHKNLKAEPTDISERPDLPQLHVAWSGNFKTLEQQKLPLQYPLDISVAQAKDGYMPGTMNLRLPKAKPKQVYVGVLFSF